MKNPRLVNGALLSEDSSTSPSTPQNWAVTIYTDEITLNTKINQYQNSEVAKSLATLGWNTDPKGRIVTEDSIRFEELADGLLVNLFNNLFSLNGKNWNRVGHINQVTWYGVTSGTIGIEPKTLLANSKGTPFFSKGHAYVGALQIISSTGTSFNVMLGSNNGSDIITTNESLINIPSDSTLYVNLVYVSHNTTKPIKIKVL